MRGYMETLSVKGVTESVAQNLRINIIEGELAPGQKLNELELAERLGISRPPLREAFRLLEGENLVVSVPRKGCNVTEVSIRDCRQIYKAREMIECYTIDCFEARGIKELPEVVSALDLAGKGFPILSYDNDREKIGFRNPYPDFHIKMVESTGNQWLIRFYNMIAPTLARYQFMCYVPDFLDKTQKEHKHILDLIKKGSYKEAKELLRAHINSWVKFLESRMKQYQQTKQLNQQ
jgi:DNA-binding GntR family transcriptional regulator